MRSRQKVIFNKKGYDIMKSKKNSVIHVAFGIRDEKKIYYRYVLSVISQIAKKTIGTVHIHILHDNTINEDIINVMKHTAQGLNQEISFYDISIEREYKKMQNGTLYRLFLPKVCSSLDKIIYLDADVIIGRDLRKLWEIDLEKKILGAVLDVNATREVINKLSQYYDKKIVADSYFNAGVLLINLDAMRRSTSNLSREYLDFIDKYPHALLLDQDFLNYKYQGEYKELSYTFNFIPSDVDLLQEEIISKNVIVHFAGLYKPWNCRNPLVLKIIFQNMLSSFPEESQAYEISSYMSDIPYNYCKKTELILYNTTGNRIPIKSYISSIKFLLKEVYKVDSFRRFCHGVTMLRMMYLYNIHYRFFVKS